MKTQSKHSNLSPIVLMYHAIIGKSSQIPTDREEGANLYDLNAKNFHEQMEYLKKNDFFVTNFENLRPKNKNAKRPIIITFDDGELNNFEEAFPVLQKFNFPAYFFVTNNRIGHPAYMNYDQLKELIKNRMIVGSHSLDHIILTELKFEELCRELGESKKDLEKKLNTQVNTFSVPHGFYDRLVIQTARKVGFKYIFVSTRNPWGGSDCIPRIAIKNNWDLKRFSQALEGKTPFAESVTSGIRENFKAVLGTQNYNRLRKMILILKK